VYHPLKVPQNSDTRTLLVGTLENLGYSVMELLLTPLQFGIPNSRLRYYLLAKNSGLTFRYEDDSKQVRKHIPGRGPDWIDPRDAHSTEAVRDTSLTVHDFLLPGVESNIGTTSAKSLPYIPDRVLEKWGRLFDIVLPSSTRTCCFTRGTLFRVCNQDMTGWTQWTQDILKWPNALDPFSN
jgi:tRNA (cytosine38-C5)-methyltransferase